MKQMTDGNYEAILSLISLSKKAGKLKSGESAVIETVATGKARLVIVAEDASFGTQKKMQDKTSYYDVPLMFFSSKERLGGAIGKGEVASLVIVDDGLAKSMMDKWR